MALCGSPRRGNTHLRCRKLALANGRCHQHGGRSTGPRRLVWRPGMEAAWRARQRRQDERKALGLPWYGGRPSGRWWKAAKDDRERLERGLADIIEKLPKPPALPIEQWSASDLLTETTRQGLMRVYDIVSAPLSDDIKWARLQGEMGLGSARLMANVQAQTMQAAVQDRGWDELLARLAQNQKKAKKTADSGSEK